MWYSNANRALTTPPINSSEPGFANLHFKHFYSQQTRFKQIAIAHMVVTITMTPTPPTYNVVRPLIWSAMLSQPFNQSTCLLCACCKPTQSQVMRHSPPPLLPTLSAKPAIVINSLWGERTFLSYYLCRHHQSSWPRRGRRHSRLDSPVRAH